MGSDRRHGLIPNRRVPLEIEDFSTGVVMGWMSAFGLDIGRLYSAAHVMYEAATLHAARPSPFIAR